MENYLDLIEKCCKEGIDVFNERTKKMCKVLVGAQLEFDLSNGDFPAVTTKKLAFKTMMGELLGFFRGYDNAADFRSLNCGIWNQNANETPAWLANPNRRGEDDLGRIYGKQWIDWKSYRVVTGLKEVKPELDDYRLEMYDQYNNKALYVRSINQLEKALHNIITNPYDRSIIVSAWNPGELDQMALPPCHLTYNFIPINDKLNVVMSIRSQDIFLGCPFNIASTALFLSIMAELSGYIPGKVIIQMANAHIYEDHQDAVKEQLNNPIFSSPQLMLSSNIKKVTLDEIPGVFTRITPEDIWLENYKHHNSIKAPMAI